MTQQAPFAVVIPLYNKAGLILEALGSILEGTRLPQEIIVIDDGSTDNGAALVESLSSPLITVVRQTNRGVSAARNRGIQEASSDFISFLDADDYWEPEHLEHLDALRIAHPSAALLATGYYLLHSDGHRSMPRVRQLDTCSGPQLVTRFFDVWSRGNFFCTNSVGISRNLLNRHGIRFPEGEKLGEDQDVWFRVAELGPIAYNPTASAAYRQGISDSLSQASLPLSPLPYVARLAERYRIGCIPEIHRAGVRRLLASNQVDRALRHAHQGNIVAAVSLLRDPLSRHAGLFWWRTAMRVAMRSFQQLIGAHP